MDLILTCNVSNFPGLVVGEVVPGHVDVDLSAEAVLDLTVKVPEEDPVPGQETMIESQLLADHGHAPGLR